MASTPMRGAGILLPTYGLTGGNNKRTISPGQAHLIPAGQYVVNPGPYSFLQTLDPISDQWQNVSIFQNGPIVVSSDGQNFRIVNLTGCCVGALVTNIGSGFTSTPSVTTSGSVGGAGAAFAATVGGAISQTVTITTAGVGWNYAPLLVFAAPPAGGIQAKGYCTISGGAINAVTVTDQGAGYVSAPLVYLIPDPREATATIPGPTTASVLTAVLLVTETVVTAITCTNWGNGAYTAAPTLTVSGGGGSSATAVAIMCLAVTGWSVGAGGAGYGNAQNFAIITNGGVVVSAAGAVLNPGISTGLFIPRQSNITGTSTSGGAITATNTVVNDAGLFQIAPSAIVLAGGSGLATGQGQATLALGGVQDTYSLQPF